MGRCKTCGCDLGPCITTHISPSCNAGESPCYECGGYEATLECPFCHEVCCDDCYDEHEANCTVENGQFGVGA